MDISDVRTSLRILAGDGFDIVERQIENYQIIIPIQHEDGDMIDVYLQSSPRGGNYVRLCDFGMTLMRLSYNYDLNTPARKRIFDSILINNDVDIEDGNLFIDIVLENIYEGILKFAGCIQKICNMDYWNRETIRSAFLDDLGLYIREDLAEFSPLSDQEPIPDYPITVDWSLTCNNRTFFLFGVGSNDKAKTVAIALLEFQKVNLSFMSMVIHEDMEALRGRESTYLTKNSDKQYPTFGDFKEKGIADIYRIAAY